MNLQAHYLSLYNHAISVYKNDTYEVDNNIDSELDNRYGITLLIRPPKEIKAQISSFLNDLKRIESNQYFYPETDIHITVMSIISCYNDFNLSNINLEEYIAIIEKSLVDIASFNIQFKGLTASPSCLMIQGFLDDNTLKLIRNNLRNHFKNSNLEHSIDKRYAIQTAHSTIFRLRHNFNNKTDFINKIETYKTHNFGKFTVNQLELVYNDWYQRDAKVKTLHCFKL
ncbi:mutarotase [Tamlana nanhaiensis]|uniref:Mutarotase n=1 Tax=Neotamlana nanhaiensis TaxID=1382798 RepID=A0A0D7W1G5_9FLAO|nr:mutarotase [Tamlana nanhaiensis]KJD32965.1 mutarotase [Tamlana nanhaiensis]